MTTDEIEKLLTEIEKVEAAYFGRDFAQVRRETLAQARLCVERLLQIVAIP